MKFRIIFIYSCILLLYSCKNNSTSIKPKENQCNQLSFDKSDTSIFTITEKVYLENDTIELTLIHRSNNMIYLLQNDVLVDSVAIHSKHVVPRKNETDLFAEYTMLNSDGHFFHDDGTMTHIEPIGYSQFLYAITDLSWSANYFIIDLNSDCKIKSVFIENVHRDCLRIVNFNDLKVGVSYDGSNWNESIEDAEQLYLVFNLTNIMNDTIRILFIKKYLGSKYPDFFKSACLLNDEDIQTILTE